MTKLETLLSAKMTSMKAEREVTLALCAMLEATTPMDWKDDQFWKILRGLRKCIDSVAIYAGKRQCVEEGVSEHVRDLMCKADKKEEQWLKMAAFQQGYEALRGQLHKKLWEMPGLERGDDGFGDLCDALPLAGEEVIKGIFSDDIANFKQLEKAVAEKDRPFILDGEHYVATKLEEALGQWVYIIDRERGRLAEAARSAAGVNDSDLYG